MDALVLIVIAASLFLGYDFWRIEQSIGVISSQLEDIKRELNTTTKYGSTREILEALRDIRNAIKGE